MVFAVSNQDDHLITVTLLFHRLHRLADRVSNQASTARRTVGINSVKHHAEKALIRRQWHQFDRGTREYNQSHAIAFELLHQVKDVGLRAFEAIGGNIFSEH